MFFMRNYIIKYFRCFQTLLSHVTERDIHFLNLDKM